jgi:shikimate kinase
MKIILTGYRCVGKSSAGKMVAERLRLPFYDTDELIEKSSGRKIKEIVETNGWDEFRQKERDVIKTLKDVSEGVIALGGGAVMDNGNVECLRDNGIFVWLRAEPETIVRRLASDDNSATLRPSLSGKDVRNETAEIIASREPVYRSVADVVIKTDRQDVIEIADRICHHLSTVMKLIAG